MSEIKSKRYARKNLPHGLLDQLMSGAEPPKPRGWASRPEVKSLRRQIYTYAVDPDGDILLRWLYGKELLKANEKRAMSATEWNEVVWRSNEVESVRQFVFGKRRAKDHGDAARAKCDTNPGLTGHLYVIEFASGVLKVGRTMNPRQRLDHHSLVAAVHGNQITKQWVSDRHTGAVQGEANLIRFCETHGTAVVGREYFRGLDFDEVRKHAEKYASADDAWDGNPDAKAVEVYQRGGAT